MRVRSKRMTQKLTCTRTYGKRSLFVSAATSVGDGELRSRQRLAVSGALEPIYPAATADTSRPEREKFIASHNRDGRSHHTSRCSRHIQKRFTPLLTAPQVPLAHTHLDNFSTNGVFLESTSLFAQLLTQVQCHKHGAINSKPYKTSLLDSLEAKHQWAI